MTWQKELIREVKAGFSIVFWAFLGFALTVLVIVSLFLILMFSVGYQG